MGSLEKMSSLGIIVAPVKAQAGKEVGGQVFRFDIFKGVESPEGKVVKVRSVGSAYLREGFKTYCMSLKTFLKDEFYLLPSNQEGQEADFVILTREPAMHLKRKYFWNSVGEGRAMEGVNSGLLKLSWDVLGSDFYMSFHPLSMRATGEVESENAA